MRLGIYRNDLKMNDILSDTTKFIKINKQPGREVRRLEDKVRNYIRTLSRLGLLTKTQYDSIFPTGSTPALLYGLSKVHKNNIPLRPIMSSTNTYNRKLSQFLIPFLLPLTCNQFTVKNTFSFCREINKFTCVLCCYV